MGWKTNEDSVKVISKETIEDRNPQLYVKRAEEYAKKGMYREAEAEYDKAIIYSGKRWSFYLKKADFYSNIQERGKAIRLYIFVLSTKLHFLVFYAIAWMMSVNFDVAVSFIYLGNIALGIKIVKMILKKFKIKWSKYIIRIIILIVLTIIFAEITNLLKVGDSLIEFCIFLFWMYVIKTVIEIIRDMVKYRSAEKHQEDLFETAFGDSKSSKKKSANIVVPSTMQQNTKKEQNQSNRVFQQDIPPNHKETLQKEKYSAGVDGGMLLALDVPIQKNNILLDKVIVKKNVVKLPVNGENMQIDVSCKKCEAISNIDFEQCERYEIKKGSLVYVLVAIIEYCINIWSNEWNDSIESTCEKLTAQLNHKLNPYGIRTRLSKKGWQFLENNILITFEDVIFLLNSKAV